MAYETATCIQPICEATALQLSPTRNRIQLEAAVKQLISERRRRSGYFPCSLFADPAGDLLLVLTLAQARQHRLTITQLCDPAGVPSATALRWIGKLAEQRLFVRRDDERDKRRQFIELSQEGYELMAAYCSASPLAVAVAAGGV